MPVEISSRAELDVSFRLLRNGPDFKEDDYAASEGRGTLFADGRMDLCKQVCRSTTFKSIIDAVIDFTVSQH